MNNSPKRIPTPLTVAVVVLAFGIFTALLLSEHSRHAAILHELRQEAEDLRAQMETRDSTVSSLQAEVHQLRGGAVAAGTPTALPGGLELAHLVADLALQQSNIAVMVERLLTRTSDAPPPEVAAQRREVAIAAWEAAAQDEQQKLEAAKQRATELLVSLSVPAEVSTMDAAKALDTASLRAYWPYFEAKRDRDSLRFFAERLQMRLTQERVDARVEGAR